MKRAFLILSALLFCAPLFAQTTTPAPSSPMFTATTSAVALHLNGQTVAGTDASVSFALTNNIIVASENVLAPSLNFQGYYASARYNLATLLGKSIAKTNIKPGTFNPYLSGMIGVARNVPATGIDTQHFSGAIGGGVDFDLTSSGNWIAGPRFQYLHAQGFGPSPNGVIISANLTFVFSK